MKQINTLLVCAGMIPATMVCAQEQTKDSTLNRTVVVENQYNPEVMDAFKVNVLPKVEEPAVKKKDIDYSTAVRPLNKWVVSPMEVMSRSTVQPDEPRGYIRGAYGSRNNADAKAAYLWNITDKDRLDVMGSFHGLNGNIPVDEEDWKSRFYRLDISADYMHRFRKIDLRLGGDFSAQMFNYIPDREALPVTPDKNSQRFTAGGGFVGVRSYDSGLPVQFDVQVGMQTANRHSDPKFSVDGIGYDTENRIKSMADVWGDMGNGQQIGLALEMNNLFYKDNRMKSYTSLEMNPYYTLHNDSWKLRLGAHIDWQGGHGNTLEVAPDVKAEYVFAGSYAVYAQATGGRVLNDFRRLNELSPYGWQDKQMKSSYTQTDAQLGFKASPVSGLGLKLFGGYRIAKNEVFTTSAVVSGAYYRPYMLQDKAKVAYGGAELKYAYKDWFDLGVNGTFYHWDTEGDDGLLLVYKPRYSVEAYTDAKIVPASHIRLNYRYEGREEYNGKQADAINDLSAEATYEVFSRFNVFMRAGNLLNKNYIAETGYPVQGFHVLAGVSYRF